jgi:hypothetical protein
MILKFVLKNLILVMLLAFAINFLIKINLPRLTGNVNSPEAKQYRALTGEDMMQDRHLD